MQYSKPLALAKPEAQGTALMLVQTCCSPYTLHKQGLDGLVNCTLCGKGALEIKCPYKYRHVKPHDITDSTFCSENVAGNLVLKKNHNYYYHVQGQMGVAKLPWADFLVWTPVGCSVERVRFDENLWTVMISLTNFYGRNFVAELFSRRVKRGKLLDPQSLADN